MKKFQIGVVMVVLFLMQYKTFIVGAEETLGNVLIPGNKIVLKNGMDLSGKSICRFEPKSSNMIAVNINFDGCAFSGTQELFDISFYNCSFRKARIHNLITLPVFGDNNDFTDADILDIGQIYMTRKQLESTFSFKQKFLTGIYFSGSDLSGIDFSGFTLRKMGFGGATITNCTFTDAVIEECTLGNEKSRITLEQLQSTRNFKDGHLINMRLNIEWPEELADFSGMNLTGCFFGPNVNRTLGTENQAKVNLTDSVITNCDFRKFKGITLENIKSTWNYKHNRMEGIQLPEEIQKALDAEKDEQ